MQGIVETLFLLVGGSPHPREEIDYSEHDIGKYEGVDRRADHSQDLNQKELAVAVK